MTTDIHIECIYSRFSTGDTIQCTLCNAACSLRSAVCGERARDLLPTGGRDHALVPDALRVLPTRQAGSYDSVHMMEKSLFAHGTKKLLL